MHFKKKEKIIMPKKIQKASKSNKKPSLTHDHFFKLFYSNPKLAQELFQLAFSKKEWEAYDWNQLKIEKDTFENKRADLVFSVPLKKNPSIKLKIFILLEHKSFYDKNLFDQLLKYQILIRDHSIKHLGRPTPVIPVLFYHGKQAMRWKLSLQEEDFGSVFSEIPVESRKSMLNYELKIINTQDLKVRKAFKGKKFKSRGILSLLSEIWDIKNPSPEKVARIVFKFEDLFKNLTVRQQRIEVSKVYQYLVNNAGLKDKTWKIAEKLIIKKGILKEGGIMDIKEFFREEGRYEGIRKGIRKGRQEGRQKGRQEIILNMLKKQSDISFISELTGLSKKEIRKLKNGLS